MKKLKKLIAKLKKEETKYWLDRQEFEVLDIVRLEETLKEYLKDGFTIKELFKEEAFAPLKEHPIQFDAEEVLLFTIESMNQNRNGVFIESYDQVYRVSPALLQNLQNALDAIKITYFVEGE